MATDKMLAVLSLAIHDGVSVKKLKKTIPENKRCAAFPY